MPLPRCFSTLLAFFVGVQCVFLASEFACVSSVNITVSGLYLGASLRRRSLVKVMCVCSQIRVPSGFCASPCALMPATAPAPVVCWMSSITVLVLCICCPCRYGVACCNNKHYNKEMNSFLSHPDEAGEVEFTSKHTSAVRHTVMAQVEQP